MWGLLRPDEGVHARLDDDGGAAHLLAAMRFGDLVGQPQRIGRVRLGPLTLSELIERDTVDMLHEPLVADPNRFASIRPPHEVPKQTDTATDALLEPYVTLVDEDRALGRCGIVCGERSTDRRYVPDESFD